MNGPDDKPKFDFSKPPPPGQEQEWEDAFMAEAQRINRELGLDFTEDWRKAGDLPDHHDTLCGGNDLT